MKKTFQIRELVKFVNNKENYTIVKVISNKGSSDTTFTGIIMESTAEPKNVNMEFDSFSIEVFEPIMNSMMKLIDLLYNYQDRFNT